jgi:hypothetical protein
MAGDRAVVYLAAPEEGRFIEREVRLGASAGDRVDVTSGVQPGDRVVTKGSFIHARSASASDFVSPDALLRAAPSSPRKDWTEQRETRSLPASRLVRPKCSAQILY